MRVDWSAGLRPGAVREQQRAESETGALLPMSPTNLMDGRAIAAQIQSELSQRIAALKSRGLTPGLAFVRVGEDPASKVYVGRKQKVCAEL